MEDCKLWYLNALLSRVSTPDTHLSSYIRAVRGLEEQARRCYPEAIMLSSDEFVQMVVVDACFIIELLRRYSKEELKDRNDPIFSSAWMLHSIRRDLILLENQLPLFVLQYLFNLISDPKEGQDNLTELALRFFHNKTSPVYAEFESEAKHLLHLLRNSFIPPHLSMNSKGMETSEFVYCVKDLLNAGIKFKKKETGCGLLDITFNHGVLEIPSIQIDSYMDTLFRNLIALEQCSSGSCNQITSYACLLNNLIRTTGDVEHLRCGGIVAHRFGNDENLLIHLNKICNKVVVHGFCYAELCEQVNAYHRTRWHIWKTTLRGEYFRHPWAVLSSAAAILLFILTLVGTLFSILSFFIHHS